MRVVFTTNDLTQYYCKLPLHKYVVFKNMIYILGHRSHHECILKYMKSANGKKALKKGYLCPLKCANAS